MDESPRFHFFSLTFLLGFGIGAFVGVALGLMAFAVADAPSPDSLAQTEPPPTATLGAGIVMPTPARVQTNVAIEVRIGPGTAYAAVGTIGRGDNVDVVGRDERAEWVAIRFPPGSTARGWLPIRVIDNLTGLLQLAVVAPTPLPRTVSTPPISNVTGNDNVRGVPAGVTPGPGVTTTAVGLPDLTVVRASRLTDGRVQVVITNLGPGDLVGFGIFTVIADPTTRSETVRAPGVGLRAGASITIETDSFIVTAPTSVIITVDPSYSNPDGNRGNNTLTVTLSPPPTATPPPPVEGD